VFDSPRKSTRSPSELGALRKDYERGTLDIRDLDPDPIRQFSLWFEVAHAAGVPEPDAMTLATASHEGRPSARMVLLRGFDQRGFVFFTSYESRKGMELNLNPYAALVFYWHALERQVRVEGSVARTSDEESDAYFQSRPPASRLGAWASDQSRVLPDRAVLEEKMRRMEREHPDGAIPRPPRWGGYRVRPEAIEFWQGRRSRLHDRFRYRRDPADPNRWIIERLSP
jgi:pyridoxamine 5'-phosphate oxidase